MKTFLLASGALLLASTAPAFAQDSTMPATGTASTVLTTTDFGGPRAEVFGGWDRVGTRTRFDDGTTRITDRRHKSGVTAGGLVGYDMPIGGRFIVGAFGSYAISSAKDCDFGNVGNVGNGCIKAGRELEGGARIGANLGGKALIYAKGSYVNGQIRAKFSDGTNYYGGHANRDGWRAGAGAEYPVSSHAYVKAEYDYTRFKSFDATDLGVTDTSLRYDRSQVLGGFGVRF